MEIILLFCSNGIIFLVFHYIHSMLNIIYNLINELTTKLLLSPSILTKKTISNYFPKNLSKEKFSKSSTDKKFTNSSSSPINVINVINLSREKEREREERADY